MVDPITLGGCHGAELAERLGVWSKEVMRFADAMKSLGDHVYAGGNERLSEDLARAKAEIERLVEQNDRLKWQVRDTCARAEKAEAAAVKPRPYHEWHEDMGDVLWWLWPIEQPPYVGSPLDIGRTVSVDITIQIGVDVFEVAPAKAGDTGGWPWADADSDTVSRLFWTPLPDAEKLDREIRDYIRGGPDPMMDGAQ